MLTKGKTHYRTDDRGKTWRAFTLPVSPALVGRPLSFHSDPKKYGYILYQGTKCEPSLPWESNCHDEVSDLYAALRSKLTLPRRTIRKTHSATTPNYFSARHRDVSSHTVAKILNTTRTMTLSTASLSTASLRTGFTHSPPRGCSLRQTSSSQTDV